jgi:hypothetical protein
MLRLETQTGWWLITHPEHARLAGEFASHWGNALFASPEPRRHVLHGIYAHDNGWAVRDAHPLITSQGKPSAFSTELVGKYSAFEEIDLHAYLAVRREAVQLIAAQDPYAAILISMHTHNLLSERADRSTIRPDHLPWLDAFLVEQLTLQRALRDQLLEEATFPSNSPDQNPIHPSHLTPDTLHRHFQLLQACDNLSLLSCTDYSGDATLLHPFRLIDGTTTEIHLYHTASRTFQLTPYPFDRPILTFPITARHIPGHTFPNAEALQHLFHSAPLETIEVTISA